MPKKIVVGVLALAFIWGALVFFHVYYVSEGGSGNLFWNGDTAYVFIDLGTLGYRMSYRQFLGQIVISALGVGREPSDETFSTVVLTIAKSSAHRYTADGLRLVGPVIKQGNLYSNEWNSGTTLKWNADHFDKASEEEKKLPISKELVPGADYETTDGWHERCCFFVRQEEFTYSISLKDAELSLIARSEGAYDHSVDLVRPDGTTETIWKLNGDPRMVSKSEYQRIFVKK